MRCLFGFLCVCALGVVPAVGCSETTGDGGSGGSAGSGGVGGDGGAGGIGGGGGTGGADLCESVECDDLNECTDDTCNPINGLCEYPPMPDGSFCDTGACQSGVCEPISSVFSCNEQGIRDAIAVGGGPHAFDCAGPQTVITGAEIEIANNVILDGEGNLTVDGNGSHRVFSVPDDVTAELRRFTVTNGYAGPLGSEEYGGGIWNAGTLTVRHSVVSGNKVDDLGGGGIFNRGTVNLNHAEVTENKIEFFGDGGAGIYNYAHGSIELTDSTVSANQGGGIYMRLGGLTLTRSTVAGNTGVRDELIPGDGIYSQRGVTLIESTVSDNTGRGIVIADLPAGLTVIDSTVSGNVSGGIRIAFGNIVVLNSTISGNTAETGGGVLIQGGLIRLTNSTISGNTANLGGGISIINDGAVRLSNSTVTGNTANEHGSAIYSLGQEATTEIIGSLLDGDCYAFFGLLTMSKGNNIESPGDTCGFDPDGTDQVNVSAEDLNLGELADNDGPTKTHKPGDGGFGEGSVAIDQILVTECLDADGAPLTTDQRGEPRPETGGTMCDVGSFEVQP